MDKKPKARASKVAPTKAPKKTKEKSQRERFIEAARVIGVDETGQEFEMAMTKIVPPIHRPKQKNP